VTLLLSDYKFLQSIVNSKFPATLYPVSTKVVYKYCIVITNNIYTLTIQDATTPSIRCYTTAWFVVNHSECTFRLLLFIQHEYFTR